MCFSGNEKQIYKEHKKRVEKIEKSRRDLELDYRKLEQGYKDSYDIKENNLASPDYGLATPAYVQNLSDFRFVNTKSAAAIKKIIEPADLTREEYQKLKDDKKKERLAAIEANKKLPQDKQIDPEQAHFLNHQDEYVSNLDDFAMPGEHYFLPVRQRDFQKVQEKSFTNDLYTQSAQVGLYYRQLDAVAAEHTGEQVRNEEIFADYREYKSNRWWSGICGKHFYKKNKKKQIKNATKKQRKALLAIQSQSSKLTEPLMELYAERNAQAKKDQEALIKQQFEKQGGKVHRIEALNLLRTKDNTLNVLTLEEIREKYYSTVNKKAKKGDVNYNLDELFVSKEIKEKDSAAKAARVAAANNEIEDKKVKVSEMSDLFVAVKEYSKKPASEIPPGELEKLARQYQSLSRNEDKTSVFSSYFSKRNLRVTCTDKDNAHLLLMACVATSLRSMVDNLKLDNIEINPQQYGYINAQAEAASMAASMVTVNDAFRTRYAEIGEEIIGQRSNAIREKMEFIKKEFPILAKYANELNKEFGVELADSWTEEDIKKNLLSLNEKAVKTEEALQTFMDGCCDYFVMGFEDQRELLLAKIRAKDGFKILEDKAYLNSMKALDEDNGKHSGLKKKQLALQIIREHFKEYVVGGQRNGEGVTKFSGYHDMVLGSTRNMIYNAFKGLGDGKLLNEILKDTVIQEAAKITAKNTDDEEARRTIATRVDLLHKQYILNKAALDEIVDEQQKVHPLVSNYVKERIMDRLGTLMITGSFSQAQSIMKEAEKSIFSNKKEKARIRQLENSANRFEEIAKDIVDEKGNAVMSPARKELVFEYILKNNPEMLNDLSQKQSFFDFDGEEYQEMNSLLSDYIKDINGRIDTMEATFERVIRRGKPKDMKLFTSAQAAYAQGILKDLIMSTPMTGDNSYLEDYFEPMAASICITDMYLHIGADINVNSIESTYLNTDKHDMIGLQDEYKKQSLSDSLEGKKELERLRERENKNKVIKRAHLLSPYNVDILASEILGVNIPGMDDTLLKNSLMEAIKNHAFDEKFSFMEGISSDEELGKLSMANAEVFITDIRTRFKDIKDFLSTKNIERSAGSKRVYDSLISDIVTGKVSDFNINEAWESKERVFSTEGIAKTGRFLVFMNMEAKESGPISYDMNSSLAGLDVIKNRKLRHDKALRLWEHIRTQSPEMEAKILDSFKRFLESVSRSNRDLQVSMEDFIVKLLTYDSSHVSKSEEAANKRKEEAVKQVAGEDYDKYENLKEKLSNLEEDLLKAQKKEEDLLAKLSVSNSEGAQRIKDIRALPDLDKKKQELEDKKAALIQEREDFIRENMDFLVKYYTARPDDQSIVDFDAYKELSKTVNKNLTLPQSDEVRAELLKTLEETTLQLTQKEQAKERYLRYKGLEKRAEKELPQVLKDKEELKAQIIKAKKESEIALRIKETAFKQYKEAEDNYNTIRRNRIAKKGEDSKISSKEERAWKDKQRLADDADKAITNFERYATAYDNLQAKYKKLSSTEKLLKRPPQVFEELRRENPEGLENLDGTVDMLKSTLQSINDSIKVIDDEKNGKIQEIARVADSLSSVDVQKQGEILGKARLLNKEIADLEDSLKNTDFEGEKAMRQGSIDNILAENKNLLGEANDVSREIRDLRLSIEDTKTELGNLAKYIDSIRLSYMDSTRKEFERVIAKENPIDFILDPSEINELKDFFLEAGKSFGYETWVDFTEDFKTYIGEFLFCGNANMVLGREGVNSKDFLVKDEKTYKKQMFKLGAEVLDKQNLINHFLQDKKLIMGDALSDEALSQLSLKMRNTIFRMQSPDTQQSLETHGKLVADLSSFTDEVDKLLVRMAHQGMIHIDGDTLEDAELRSNSYKEILITIPGRLKQFTEQVRSTRSDSIETGRFSTDFSSIISDLRYCEDGLKEMWHNDPNFKVVEKQYNALFEKCRRDNKLTGLEMGSPIEKSLLSLVENIVDTRVKTREKNLDNVGLAEEGEALRAMWHYTEEGYGATYVKIYTEREERIKEMGLSRMLPILTKTMSFWDKAIASTNEDFDTYASTLYKNFQGMAEAIKEREGEESQKGLYSLINTIYLSTHSMEEYAGKSQKECAGLLDHFSNEYMNQGQKGHTIRDRLEGLVNEHKKTPIVVELFERLLENGAEGTDFLNDDKEFNRVVKKYEKRIKGNTSYLEEHLKDTQAYKDNIDSAENRIKRARESSLRMELGEFALFEEPEVFKAKFDEHITEAMNKVMAREGSITSTMEEYEKSQEGRRSYIRFRRNLINKKISEGNKMEAPVLKELKAAQSFALKNVSPLVLMQKGGATLKNVEGKISSVRKDFKSLNLTELDKLPQGEFIYSVMSERLAAAKLPKEKEKKDQILRNALNRALSLYEAAAENFKDERQCQRFFMYMVCQNAFLPENGEEELRAAKTDKLVSEYNSRLDDIKSMRDLADDNRVYDEELRTEILSVAEGFNMLMFTADPQQFRKAYADRLNYYRNVMVQDNETKNTMDSLKDQPGFEKLGMTDYRSIIIKSLRDYFKEELLTSESFSAIGVKDLLSNNTFIEALTGITTDSVRHDEALKRQAGHVGGDNVSPEDLDAFMERNLSVSRVKEYQEFTDARKKALLLALSMPQSTGMEHLTTGAKLLSSDPEKDAKLSDEITGEILKALNGQETKNVKCSDLMEKLTQAGGNFTSMVYERALQYVKDCEQVLGYKHTKDEWEKLNDGALSTRLVEFDLSRDKRKHLDTMRKNLSSIEGPASFKENLISQLKEQGLSKLANKIGAEGFDINRFILILQNRTILDNSTRGGREKQFANPLMRRELLRAITDNKTGGAFVLDNSTAANCQIAMENLYSYQVMDQINLEGRSLHKSDISAKALKRKTAIDSKLIENALKMMEEAEKISGQLDAYPDFDLCYNSLQSKDQKTPLARELGRLKNPTHHEDYSLTEDFLRKGKIRLTNKRISHKSQAQEDYEREYARIQEAIDNRMYMDMARGKDIDFARSMTKEEENALAVARMNAQMQEAPLVNQEIDQVVAMNLEKDLFAPQS